MLELDLRNAGDEDYKGQKNNDFDNLHDLTDAQRDSNVDSATSAFQP